MISNQNIKCLFGFHKFDIPWTSKRFRSVVRPLETKICSGCRRAAKLFHGTTDTVYQLDDNERPISWESSRMYGKYVNGVWVAGRK